jgi:predicted RNA-binding Zn-ribbon protein involved in translation (DUF1610 family)
MRRMATKGTPPTYTETCSHCGAVIPVWETVYIDGENKRCPKCGEAYKVPGSEKRQQLGNLKATAT